jgi:hypothetical protein
VSEPPFEVAPWAEIAACRGSKREFSMENDVAYAFIERAIAMIDVKNL